MRPCLGCGVPVAIENKNAGARCIDCDTARKKQGSGPRTHVLSSVRRGYDHAWRRLSKEARRLQPWCMDCGATEDLTADHLRWPARSLADVEVTCRSCNSKRGALRKNRIPISIREPLHGYAESQQEWGVDLEGGSCDRAGGATLTVTLRGDLEEREDECMVMHPDRA